MPPGTIREVAVVAAPEGHRLAVSEINRGGGTPTSLPGACLSNHPVSPARPTRFESDIATAIELDPRHLRQDRREALAGMGVARAA